MSLSLLPLCWTCSAAKIFHRADGGSKLVAGVSRVTTSHSVGQTIQSWRIGGTRRCSYPRREHYSSSSICSFSRLKFVRERREIVTNRLSALTSTAEKSCHNSPRNFRASQTFSLVPPSSWKLVSPGALPRSRFPNRQNFIPPSSRITSSRGREKRFCKKCHLQSTNPPASISRHIPDYPALDLIFLSPFFFQLRNFIPR